MILHKTLQNSLISRKYLSLGFYPKSSKPNILNVFSNTDNVILLVINILSLFLNTSLIVLIIFLSKLS